MDEQNLDIYGHEPIPWSRALEQLEAQAREPGTGFCDQPGVAKRPMSRARTTTDRTARRRRRIMEAPGVSRSGKRRSGGQRLS